MGRKVSKNTHSAGQKKIQKCYFFNYRGPILALELKQASEDVWPDWLFKVGIQNPQLIEQDFRKYAHIKLQPYKNSSLVTEARRQY